MMRRITTLDIARIALAVAITSAASPAAVGTPVAATVSIHCPVVAPQSGGMFAARDGCDRGHARAVVDVESIRTQDPGADVDRDLAGSMSITTLVDTDGQAIQPAGTTGCHLTIAGGTTPTPTRTATVTATNTPTLTAGPKPTVNLGAASVGRPGGIACLTGSLISAGVQVSATRNDVGCGVNIYPQEAENVLITHPKVADVAVFGVPNADLGEEVKAVVQPIDMSAAGPELERELIEFCQRHLAKFKCPRSIDFDEELPRHPTGKLYKRLLKDRYWRGHETRIL